MIGVALPHLEPAERNVMPPGAAGRPIAEHGAPPPGYELALLLDFEHHQRGMPCAPARTEVAGSVP